MIDTHCHVDLYPNPYEVALGAERAGVVTIAVTNLPSAFERAYPHVRPLRYVRLALGMHPLMAREHAGELLRFQDLVDRTSYIGEIGLDFSRFGKATKETQIESFRFILQTLRGKSKFITVHSRQAESAVMDILEEAERSQVVFHWYSGSVAPLERALAHGHFFSVNPAMLSSQKGRQLIARLPPERVLTETDGPFVKVGGKPVHPENIADVEARLGDVWQMARDDVSEKIKKNFHELIKPLKTPHHNRTG